MNQDTQPAKAHTPNKYQRMLDNCMADLAEDCREVANSEGDVGLETLARLQASIEFVKSARLAWQVWDEASLPDPIGMPSMYKVGGKATA